jgi:hypothetical protein
MYIHAATILLAAFLLFLVQPLIGRFILPAWGGTPAVWTVALLFFQAALFAGYAYAHGLMRLPARVQAILHGLLLLAGLAFLPVIPGDIATDGSPTLSILLLLAGVIGLPFVALAATAPLMQAWLGERPGVYRLYALSNVGSILALLAYPFALEPWIGRETQAWAWSAGYCAFALAGLAACALRFRHAAPAAAAATQPEAVSLGTRVLWVMLPACGVWMLMAVTSRMSTDIAPVPFVWVLPLVLYLFSFVVAFHGARWYQRKWMIPALILALVLFSAGASGTLMLSLAPSLALLALGLLLACLTLHGELYRLRPGHSRLTAYYLSISGGGVLGGVLVGVCAPLVFSRHFEFEIGQWLSLLSVLAALALDPSSKLRRFRPWWAWAAIGLGLLFWLDVLATNLTRAKRDEIDIRRSFFGVTRVKESEGTRTLVHGHTNHGTQFTDARRNVPTTYFGRASGVGRVLGAEGPARHVGVVGLGAGTLAVYGRPGDEFTFYELDPEVHALAAAHFTYLSDSPADVTVRIGDGRLLLAGESRTFDVLVLDAFSSSAVPVHLLTLEAFEIYARRTQPGGLIVVNVTNRHIDLQPVVTAAARHLGMQWARVSEPGDTLDGTLDSEWIIMGPDVTAHGFKPVVDTSTALPWTDDFSNLLRALK